MLPSLSRSMSPRCKREDLNYLASRRSKEDLRLEEVAVETEKAEAEEAEVKVAEEEAEATVATASVMPRDQELAL